MILNIASDSLATPLANLFHVFLSSDDIPNEQKLANDVPLFKSSDLNNMYNYRPISLYSIVCKLLEKIVCNHLVKHMC